MFILTYFCICMWLYVVLDFLNNVNQTKHFIVIVFSIYTYTYLNYLF